MKSTVFIAAALAGCFAACKSGDSKPVKPDVVAANMDTTVRPGDDFFLYANGGWIKRNPIPAEESRWTISNLVNEELYKRVRTINEKAITDSAANRSSRQLANFWLSAMDTVAIEKAGLQPLQGELTQLNAVSDIPSMMKLVADWQIKGISPCFSMFIFQDSKNSEQMAMYLYQGGLGLPNRDYYFNTDSRTTNIRNEYVKHLGKMFRLLGDDTTIAANNAASVMQLETRLAKASRKLEALRDPYANYNKFAVSDLHQLTPAVDWKVWRGNIGAQVLDSVIVGQPEFFKELQSALTSIPIAQWKTYLRWNLISSSADYLSKPFVDEDFNFYSRIIRGAKEQRPRWKRVLDTQKDVMGELVGKLFVKEYFDETAKKRYADMVEAIRGALKARIEKLDWMSDSTRQKALHKLATMKKKVGYPDTWKDFSSMEITSAPYVINMQQARAWWHQFYLNKLGKPVDRTEWDMPPQEYNAYYNPSNNEIVLPAGIFTIPGYLDAEVDDAVVYGYAAASTIGHEITHGFDDEGRKFDANGNLLSWWTEADEKKFNKKAQVMIDQFNGYVVVDTLRINGQATLGENIADLGGILLGWDAFVQTEQYKKGDKLAGLSPAQRYFLGYSLGWLGHAQKESLANQLLTDVHSPAQYRVNGPMADVDAFYSTFDVKPGDKLYRADSMRVRIW
ncbi:M13 family metallopeptidase [Paraflavitalea sp. CAU 1676]|uniref:M13 family metallopeptidase n=1 Tax=Paraflavitalea sp. CAU 1676 TaxID=3032598 RepID=UPI0023D9855C|nr:M13 family metallopeptidase [Paraflavitalea sp. CAU 1676]MDF2192671.1 M13 family metallopeptidase [Paraflavitalea sp. CAU 1676]